jgi:SAM-dependent methyltransferase
MDSVTEAVAQQYEAFPYPELAPKWDNLIELTDPSICGPLLWPEGRPREKLRILIAGCGTAQAARYALRNPSCEVLGIDLSEAAIATHERLKTERHLTNLTIRRLDLRGVASLGQTFDLISSTGVLHHLERPDEGLQALASVLDPQGALIAMVYGSAARAGVYLLQDAFKRMGLGIDQRSVDIVRTILASLPKQHYVNWYKSNSPDLESDAGIVDTFLHVQDRAYSVPQVLQLVANCGLQFQAWEENHFYFPEGNVRPGTPLWDRLKATPERDQWAAVENLLLTMGRHTFVACRPERGYREISFSTAGYLSYFPKQVPGLRVVERSNPDSPRHARCRRGNFEFSMTHAEAILFVSSDGKRPIAQMLEHPAFASPAATAREEFARSFFERMWKLGHLWMLTAPL